MIAPIVWIYFNRLLVGCYRFVFLTAVQIRISEAE